MQPQHPQAQGAEGSRADDGHPVARPYASAQHGRGGDGGGFEQGRGAKVGVVRDPKAPGAELTETVERLEEKNIKNEEIEKLNTWYYTDAPHQVRAKLDAARRVDSFAEVVQGLDAETALFEARRCLSCGNCFECDNCYGVCPDNAIIKLGAGNRYRIDTDFCKGCGLCAAECPCGAIDMVPEQT